MYGPVKKSGAWAPAPYSLDVSVKCSYLVRKQKAEVRQHLEPRYDAQ